MALGYRDSLRWLLFNDDTEFLDEDEGHFSVTTALVADIYGHDTDKVVADLKKMRDKLRKEEKL
jgi:hypothetical protein